MVKAGLKHVPRILEQPINFINGISAQKKKYHCDLPSGDD